MKNFYIHSMGCKSNQFEGSIIKEKLIKNGFEEVKSIEDVNIEEYREKYQNVMPIEEEMENKKEEVEEIKEEQATNEIGEEYEESTNA